MAVFLTKFQNSHFACCVIRVDKLVEINYPSPNVIIFLIFVINGVSLYFSSKVTLHHNRGFHSLEVTHKLHLYSKCFFGIVIPCMVWLLTINCV